MCVAFGLGYGIISNTLTNSYFRILTCDLRNTDTSKVPLFNSNVQEAKFLGKRFSSDEEVKSKTIDWVTNFDVNFYEVGILNWLVIRLSLIHI